MKMKMAPKHLNSENKNIYHGYFPFIEGDPSHKEFYDMPRPLEDISKWEREGCPLYEFIPWIENDENGEHKWIIESFQNHLKCMHKLALKLIRCFAISFGKNEDYFDNWFKDECSSTFRAIHYQPREKDTEGTMSADHFKLVTPEHTDSGFITLLSTFMFPGLQVKIDGQYKNIKPVENAIVVNIGDTLERISNYQIKAT